MTWFKVDDGFWAHPKTESLSDGALALWVRAGSWCARYLTDGHIPLRTVAKLGHTEAQAVELVQAGLWCGVTHGVTHGVTQDVREFVFHQWCAHQDSKAEIEKTRERGRDRKRDERFRQSLRKLEMSRMDERGTSARSHTTLSSPLLSSPDPDPEKREKAPAAPAGKPAKPRGKNLALEALKSAMRRHIAVPPALSDGPAKKAAARLRDIVAAGHASDLDGAADALVKAAVASKGKFPWCLLDAKPAPPQSNSLNYRPAWMP